MYSRTGLGGLVPRISLSCCSLPALNFGGIADGRNSPVSMSTTGPIIRKWISSAPQAVELRSAWQAQDTYWAQYSFQFAHEFCHALANYANNPRQLVRYPPNANLWLEESLCETASLFALRAMSRSWRTAPPYPAWRSYAPWLNAYAEERLARPEHHLPAGTPFLVWFHEKQSALRQNSAIRERNTIVALQLLPLFEAEPRGWETLTFLNRGSTNRTNR